MQVIVDLHGGDPANLSAKNEFQEIKARVMYEVADSPRRSVLFLKLEHQREVGRTYGMMWKRYHRRVLLAMSSQAFAQLVNLV